MQLQWRSQIEGGQDDTLLAMYYNDMDVISFEPTLKSLASNGGLSMYLIERMYCYCKKCISLNKLQKISPTVQGRLSAIHENKNRKRMVGEGSNACMLQAWSTPSKETGPSVSIASQPLFSSDLTKSKL
jgi:hypothetical protein